MSRLKPILILQTGDAPQDVIAANGNYDTMFLQATGLGAGQVRIVHLPGGERPDAPQAYSGVLITGSAAMVTERLAWSEFAAAWLRQAMDAEIPIFGVCYGHQLLAHALGGEVDYLADGMEVGTQPIELLPAAANDPLIGQLPERFPANLIHSQTVVTPPRGATVLARSARDPHQILRYRHNVVTTQFHPEFSAAVMHDFLSGMTVQDPERGPELALIGRELSDTPDSEALMAAFVRQCLQAV
ncbi:glutamine amidotransferase [Enterobacteriales bacterium SAP-6]|uniref:Glutamine amidotransferase n=2 Tax=Acerihabitans arboris TaxID=2691583 RepID=A0A845SKU0_9GAMM|nr:glutamine amidotransferase [Acerihabitans arboris]NDL63584.1 glutamine amidotransferase [Acerihabitans arboris]